MIKKTKNLDIVIGMDVFPVLLLIVGMVYVPHIYTGMILNTLDFIPELTDIEGLSDHNSLEGNGDILPIKSYQNFDLCKSNTFSNVNHNSMKCSASAIEISIPELEIESSNNYPLSSLKEGKKNTGLTGLKKRFNQAKS